MVKKKAFIFILMIFTFITLPQFVYAQDYMEVEIYNFDKQKIEKTVEVTPEIKKLAANYLSNINGVYGKFNPVPESGFGVKIPLEEPIKITNDFVNQEVDLVIVMFPKHESPFLILFEKNDNIMCYTFKGNTRKLLKLIKYKGD